MMTVRGDNGTVRTFGFDDRPRLTLKGNRNPLLVDLKPGYDVRIGFHTRPGGQAIADTVMRIASPESK